MRRTVRAIYFAAFVSAGMFALSFAVAQTFPDKSIHIVVPFAPGGSADLVARTIGTRLAENFGKPVIIENRAGAGGDIGVEAVIRAAADGYTLLSTPNGPITIAPHVHKPKYDVSKDLVPVAMEVLVAAGIGVNPKLPIHNIAELIRYAKENPVGLNFSHSGVGNTMHLAGELLKNMTGTNLIPVAYRGTSPAVTAILTGDVPFGIADMTSLLPLAAAGKVRIIAVTNSTRVAIAPDVPTVAESGLPVYAADAWIGMFAPARTPAAVIDRLNAEVGKILARSDVQKNFLSAGLEPKAMLPDETRKFVLADIERWGKLVKSVNLNPH